MNLQSEYIQAAMILDSCESLLVLTGAGISAESGIPTYRDNGDSRYDDPDAIVYARDLTSNPSKVWRHIQETREFVAKSKPNDAHLVLADWEKTRRFERFLIATQNIDGLHDIAGNRRITELHGNVWEVAEPKEPETAETDADYFALQDESQREDVLKRLARDNGKKVWENRDVPFAQIPPYDDSEIRPNVVFFEEPYGDRKCWVKDFIEDGVDAVLVIGCSGTVGILPELVGDIFRDNPKARIININPKENSVPEAQTYIPAPATEAMLRIAEELSALSA
jgi:NAD-dependent SIR2 family protein deacetylase